MESTLAKLIQERTPSLVDLSFNNSSKFDLSLNFKDNTTTTLEVKTDYLANKTGNVAIETWCRGFSSGIITSEADYVVYIFPKEDNPLSEVILYQRTALLELLNENFKQVEGGDYWRGRKSAKMTLIPKKYFLSRGRDMLKEIEFEFSLRDSK